MKINTEINGNKITVTYELTDKELEILNYVKDTGYIEFRVDYTNSDRLDYSGIYFESECSELINHEFLIMNTDAWHMEYNLSDLANKILS